MIFLVRHGEATAAWGDALDPGLSELGVKQAEATAQRLDRLGAMFSISSPMRRCRETAEAFERQTGLRPAVVHAVSEVETPDDVDDRPNWLRQIMDGRWSDVSEDLRAWRDTAVSAVEALEDNTVVFSHFVAINAIVGALSGRDEVLVFRPANCSITTLERGAGGLQVKQLGAEAPPVVL